MPGQPRVVPTSGSLSPRWGLAARPLAFQGLTPLATNPGSSGAGTRNAQNDHNNGNTLNTHNTGNTYTTYTTYTTYNTR